MRRTSSSWVKRKAQPELDSHGFQMQPQSVARNVRPRFPTECADTDVANSVRVSQNLHSQSTDSIFVHTEDLGKPNPFSSTLRKRSNQHNQPGSRTRGTGTRRNVRRENMTGLAASSGDDVSRIATQFGSFLFQFTDIFLNFYTDVLPTYVDLGDCNQRCRHCGATFWYEERLKGNLSQYHLCWGENLHGTRIGSSKIY
ncbi:hypothetical protein Tco_0687258 [Tanacetum coccineum]